MADRERAMRGIEHCLDSFEAQCEGCPYRGCRKDKLREEIVGLLKKQVIHPVNGITPRLFFCPDCEKQISDTFVYCPYCGKKVLWDA